MTMPPTNNPFVMPGLGQTGEMASNPLFASLEMMRQTFATLSGGGGLANGLTMQPTLDPAELEKKISELKSVESWLKLNLSMLSSTIQGMEVQLATITTLRQFVSSSGLSGSTPFSQSAPSAPGQIPALDPSASLDLQPSNDAAHAWWNMLTQQFGQLASATAASMQATTVEQTTAPTKTSATKRPATKKSVTSKKSVTPKKPNR